MQLRILLRIAAWVVTVAAVATAGTLCGPGAHWVDTCTGGIDQFPSIALVTVAFGGSTYEVSLAGPTIVWAGASFGGTIQTELVSLSLTGISPGLGPITLTGGDGVADGLDSGPLHSPGEIKEDAGNPVWADSFFDVFFEIDLPGLSLINEEPVRVTSRIDRTPPIGFPYVHQGPINLFNKLDPGGPAIAQIVDVSHTPTPEPATLGCIGAALLALACKLRRATGPRPIR